MKLQLTYMALLTGSLLLCQCKEGNSVASNSTGHTESTVSSSNSSVLKPVEYADWCRAKENGLFKSKQIEDLIYDIQFKPASYVACLEEQSNSISEATLSKKLEELDGLYYFDFKIEIANGIEELLKYNVSSAEEYNQRVNYFAFDMQKDIKLINGNDTLDCQLFHCERAYDVAPYATFLLGFPKKEINGKAIEFFYQDNVFKKGIIKFSFTKDEINHIPKLQTI